MCVCGPADRPVLLFRYRLSTHPGYFWVIDPHLLATLCFNVPSRLDPVLSGLCGGGAPGGVEDGVWPRGQPARTGDVETFEGLAERGELIWALAAFGHQCLSIEAVDHFDCAVPFGRKSPVGSLRFYGQIVLRCLYENWPAFINCLLAWFGPTCCTVRWLLKMIQIMALCQTGGMRPPRVHLGAHSPVNCVFALRDPDIEIVVAVVLPRFSVWPEDGHRTAELLTSQFPTTGEQIWAPVNLNLNIYRLFHPSEALFHDPRGRLGFRGRRRPCTRLTRPRLEPLMFKTGRIAYRARIKPVLSPYFFVPLR